MTLPPGLLSGLKQLAGIIIMITAQIPERYNEYTSQIKFDVCNLITP